MFTVETYNGHRRWLLYPRRYEGSSLSAGGHRLPFECVTRGERLRRGMIDRHLEQVATILVSRGLAGVGDVNRPMAVATHDKALDHERTRCEQCWRGAPCCRD